MFNTLSDRIFNGNVKAGWWETDTLGKVIPRDRDTLYALFHSEVSEALEGKRKNLMDDHLQQYPMYVVELADTMIRIFDYFGYARTLCDFDVTPRGIRTLGDLDVESECIDAFNITYLHYLISKAWYSDDDLLFDVLGNCISLISAEGFNWSEIVEAKLKYNANREDHKPENRAKANGKKF